jgi:hypothetical protein
MKKPIILSLVLSCFLLSNLVNASNELSVNIDEYYAPGSLISISGTAGVSESIQLHINSSVGFFHSANTTSNDQGEYLFYILLRNDTRPDVYHATIISPDNKVISKFKVSKISPEKIAEYLISLAEKSKEKIENALIEVEIKGLEASTHVLGLYEEGLMKIQEAQTFLNKGENAASIESAKNALNSLQEALKKLYIEFEVQPPEEDQSTRVINTIKQGIEQTKKHVERLQKANKNARLIGIYSPIAEEALKEIISQIEASEEALENRNLELSKQSLDNAKTRLRAVNQLLTQKAKMVKQVLLRRYRNYFIIRLMQMKETILRLSSVLPEYNITRATNYFSFLQTRLNQTQTKIQNGQLNEALKDLKDIQNSLENALGQLNGFRNSLALMQMDRLQAKIQSINTTITRQEYEGEDTSLTQQKLEELLKALNEVKDSLSSGNTESALSILSKTLKIRDSWVVNSNITPDDNKTISSNR